MSSTGNFKRNLGSVIDSNNVGGLKEVATITNLVATYLSQLSRLDDTINTIQTRISTLESYLRPNRNDLLDTKGEDKPAVQTTFETCNEELDYQIKRLEWALSRLNNLV